MCSAPASLDSERRTVRRTRVAHDRRPPALHALRHPRAHRAFIPRVDDMQHRRVSAIEPDQRERERPLQRMLRPRLRDPRPRRDDAALSYFDELARRRLAALVVLLRRHEHAPVRGAHAEDPPLLEPAEEPPDHRPDTARVRVLERVCRCQRDDVRQMRKYKPDWKQLKPRY